MKIVCVVPARGKSKRVKNKNLRILCGKPLIAHSIESAIQSRLCNKVIVSTDSKKIARVAKAHGAEVIMRPAKLALDTSPIDDSIRHVIGHLKRKENFIPDIVVLLQANVPVRKSGEIDDVLRMLTKNRNASSIATVYSVDQRPEWAKVIDNKTKMIKPFMKPTNSYRKQDLPELYLLDGAIVAVRTSVLLKAKGIKKIHAYLGDKIISFVHDKKYAVEVDEAEDFWLAEYYLKKYNYKCQKKFS